MNTVEPAMFNYDPFSLEAMHDPLPIYKVLRDKQPVYYSEKYDGFFFTRFEDILKLLSHINNELITTEVRCRHRDSFPTFTIPKRHRFRPPIPSRWHNSLACR